MLDTFFLHAYNNRALPPGVSETARSRAYRDIGSVEQDLTEPNRDLTAGAGARRATRKFRRRRELFAKARVVPCLGKPSDRLIVVRRVASGGQGVYQRQRP